MAAFRTLLSPNSHLQIPLGGNAKPLSPDAVVEYADIMMDRLPIEESTIDALNTGGHNEVGDDWKKIKL